MKTRVQIQPSTTKPIVGNPHPKDASCNSLSTVGQLGAEILMFESLNGHTKSADDVPLAYCRLTCEPLSQVSKQCGCKSCHNTRYKFSKHSTAAYLKRQQCNLIQFYAVILLLSILPSILRRFIV